MLQPRDCAARNCRISGPNVMRACALTLLVFLVLYMASMTDVHIKTAQSIQSLNISMYIQNAVDHFQSNTKRAKIQRERKLIILWTDYFSNRDWLPTTTDLQCSVPECDATSDRTLLANSSAVILHWRNIKLDDLPECVPSKDTRCPPWVLFNKEAPPHTSRDILETIQNNVQWTVTYRKDSDVYAPYGKVVPKRIRSSSVGTFNTKRRLLCWLVSNCNTPSRREVLVGELEDYMNVDIYGACGVSKCPYELVKDCYRWLSDRCMFYLSLENSNCRDYTTEKLYYALASGMVPVVVGNSSNYSHLPPRSFVNAADFTSPKELSEYLVSLSKDKRKYLSYFLWKRDYEVKDLSFKWFCDLCEKLHAVDVNSTVPERNLASWWFDQSQCTSWRNL